MKLDIPVLLALITVIGFFIGILTTKVSADVFNIFKETVDIRLIRIEDKLDKLLLKAGVPNEDSQINRR